MKEEKRNGKRDGKEFRHIVERFRQMQQHEEVAKEKEFKRRRDSRQRRNIAIKTDNRLVQYKRIYILSSFALISGSIMTFGSVVKGLGEGSILWTYRSSFLICGPVTLGLGVILLLLATGLVYEREAKIKRRMNIRLFDMGDSFNSSNFNREKRSSCQTESYSKPLLLREESSSGSSATDTSGNSCNREKSSDYRSKSKIGRQTSEESEMEVFLDSSLSSGESTPAGLSFSAKWAALAKFPEKRNINQIKQNAVFTGKDSSPPFTLNRGVLPSENCIFENETEHWKNRDVEG
ncbi:uncharacterized protein LOC117330073 [Pecten maximus]|uniref:uncharacterized protein LOC117330073 n=1 Tax=Pecten maximus TaxID=6579 RepID=UPI00145865B6|nr:uncharacterized protein LOC117330073 [Pecten maximus]